MAGASPDSRQFAQLPAIGYEDEVPRLPVLRGRGPAACLEDLVQVCRRDRAVGERPHVAPRLNCFPGLHAASNARNPSFILGRRRESTVTFPRKRDTRGSRRWVTGADEFCPAGSSVSENQPSPTQDGPSWSGSRSTASSCARKPSVTRPTRRCCWSASRC